LIDYPNPMLKVSQNTSAVYKIKNNTEYCYCHGSYDFKMNNALIFFLDAGYC